MVRFTTKCPANEPVDEDTEEEHSDGKRRSDHDPAKESVLPEPSANGSHIGAVPPLSSFPGIFRSMSSSFKKILGSI